MLRNIIFLISAIVLSVNCDISYRLPNNSIPLNYDLTIKVNLENKINAFMGQVKINIKILQTSNIVTIHAKKLHIHRISIVSETKQYSNLVFKQDIERDFLQINLPKLFNKDDEFLLDISYFGNLSLVKSGFSRKGIMLANYIKNFKTENYIFAAFEPTYARECFPCYDEPATRAKFNLRLEHHSSYDAIANMPVLARIQSKRSNYVITSFEETPAMQSYLLAFVITKFKYLSVEHSRIPQRIYGRDEILRDKKVTDLILPHLGKILEAFEDYFNISYSLPKLDHVFGEYGTAIENWGIIGYSERYILDYESRRVLFHEISHQYFGNLVSPKLWHYIWLNEGFASFYQMEIFRIVFPEETDYIDNYIYRSYVTVLNYEQMYEEDDCPSSLNSKAFTPLEIFSKFSLKTYNKGSVIIRMFYNAISPNTFTKGIRKYLLAHQFSSADPNDLHEALQEAIDEDYPNNSIDIGNFMSTWEDQSSFPVIKVRKEGNKLILSQKPYQNCDKNFAIPITFTSPSFPDYNDLNPKYWMTTKSFEIENFTDNWVVFNNQQIGYYLIEYDDDILNEIVRNEIHESNKIHEFNRQFLKEVYDF